MVNFQEVTLKEVHQIARDVDHPRKESAERFIIRKYERLVHALIRNGGYYLPGGEYDDLFSYGLLGLSKAIKDFDESKGNAQEFNRKFENFLNVCITRQLISAIKSGTRFKNMPLNKMTSLDSPLPDNNNLTVMDLIASRSEVQFQSDLHFLNPEEHFISHETVDNYAKKLDERMSKREKAVNEVYLSKVMTYQEMSEVLGEKKAKHVDNAVQRIKRKLKRIMEEEEQEIRKYE